MRKRILTIYEITPNGRGLLVVIIVPVVFTIVLVALRRHHHHCWIARILKFVIVHHPPPLPLPGSDEVHGLFDLLIPSHVVLAADPPDGHVCNVVIRRATVILASSASPATASATATPMLRGHLPPQVAMIPAMLIPCPLASAHPNAIAVATVVAAHVLPEAWARAPLIAAMKAMHAQEAGRGGKVRN